MQSTQLKRALGLPDRLPVEGTGNINLGGVLYYVRPLYVLLKGTDQRSRKRRMSHRLRAICPACRRDISAGRLDQHLAIHN